MIEGMSRRAFGGSSGTYNVRASELARDRRLKTLLITVAFLDDTQHTFEVEKRAKGQALLDKVFQHLELIEKDYFGLQFRDPGSTSSTENMQRWLEPTKPLKKQLRTGQQQVPLHFSVKFYVSDPSKLQEEYTRYHFFLQVKRDVLEGRLAVSPATACLLASYAVQSELGDYNLEEHAPNYLSEMRLMAGQTEEMEKRIAELHKLHKGQTPADAEFNFLNHAKQLDMYGVDLHNARDSSGKDIQLGVTSIGLVVFHNGMKINTFSWSKIVKISFKRKQFFIQLRREASEDYDTLLGFNVASYRSCKTLWKACVEHHTFFRLHTPRPLARRFFFALGSRFHYSGRTEFQTVEEGRRRARLQRTFIRSPSKRLVRQTMPEEKAKPTTTAAVTVPPARTARVANGTALPHRPYDGFNKVQSLGAKEPRKAWAEGVPSDDEGGFLERERGERAAFSPPLPVKVLAYVDEEAESDVPSSPTIVSSPSPPTAAPSPPPVPQLPQITLDLPLFRPEVVASLEEATSGLARIRLRPDDQGRFGFNVKGGSDLGMPVIVSRVLPNTPADSCFPRLNEGDQVVLINGRDVSGMTHEQVVSVIRASRETLSGELTLTVRQNEYVAADEAEEPAFQYVPEESTSAASSLVPGGDALAESMLLLTEGLESGASMAQFDQLYRRKPGLSTSEARRPENLPKNRYRDISPYDSTRVVLRSSISTDYINANHVNMDIPGSGIINRYIATQGPLPNTVSDFWLMVWEAQSSLVVMLTTVVERGRVKCEQYWPPLGQSQDYGGIRVVCSRYKEETGFVLREFSLVHLQSSEERHVSHMQYMAWPDHGVPEEASTFVDFVQRVRCARAGDVAPVVVHCSAGIGRTGVLILMETAMGLVEANEPVFPLDAVASMRDQRAMMIQTASQYRYVCECILKVYREGIVKPLPEFQR